MESYSRFDKTFEKFSFVAQKVQHVENFNETFDQLSNDQESSAQE